MKVHRLPRHAFLALVERLAGPEGWGHTNFGATDFFGSEVHFVDAGQALIAWEMHTEHGHFFCHRSEDLRAELFPANIKVVAATAPAANWHTIGEVVFLRRNLQDWPAIAALSGIGEHYARERHRQQFLRGPLGEVYWTEVDGVYRGRWWAATDARTGAGLIARALWLARERGCQEARTWVDADLAGSLAMHQALGFRPTGVRWARWVRRPES
jgi:hypothetical protein